MSDVPDMIRTRSDWKNNIMWNKSLSIISLISSAEMKIDFTMELMNDTGKKKAEEIDESPRYRRRALPCTSSYVNRSEKKSGSIRKYDQESRLILTILSWRTSPLWKILLKHTTTILLALSWTSVQIVARMFRRRDLIVACHIQGENESICFRLCRYDGAICSDDWIQLIIAVTNDFCNALFLCESLRRLKLREGFVADRRDTVSERQMTTTEINKFVSYDNFRNVCV